MTSVANFDRRQMTEPGLRATEGLRRLNTTLYDVISVLQTVVEPDKNNLIVAVIAHWIRSGRLSLL